MSMFRSLKQCLFHHFADFSGRASFSEFWWFAFFVIVCNCLSFALVIHTNNDEYFLIMFAFWLVAIIPYTAATVRRLHDAGYSGTTLFYHFLPLWGDIIIIYRLFQSGEWGENKWGPDPAEEITDVDIDDIWNAHKDTSAYSVGIYCDDEFYDWKLFVEKIKFYLQNRIEDGNVTIVAQRGSVGTMCKKIALDYDDKVQLKFWAGKKIDCQGIDAFIIFWNVESSKTKRFIDDTKNANHVVRVVQYDNWNAPWTAQLGIRLLICFSLLVYIFIMISICVSYLQ